MVVGLGSKESLTQNKKDKKMNNDQMRAVVYGSQPEDNLLTVSVSLKSWSSAIQLISTIGGTVGVIAFIYECFSDVSIAILSVGLVSIIASALTGFLIAKCLEAGSLALQSLSIIQIKNQ